MRLSRLRSGELLAGASAVLLGVLMFGVHWYGGPPPKTGWEELTSLRWLVLVAIVASLALAILQASRPAPALPVTMSVFVTVLALPTVLWLIYRVVIDPAVHERLGAWLGLISACLILVGGVLSMRQEGVSPGDEPGEILTVRLRHDSAATQ